MILTGNQILSHIGNEIIIEPFTRDNLNPNSYNLTLSPVLMVYDSDTLDMKRNNPTKQITIPDEGYTLQPGELYLAQTLEYTETHNFVPIIIGRSSMGRLGLGIHVTAGFGDVGFMGHWTMELTVVKPLKIYHGIKICQIYYQSILGDITEYQSSKYQNNSGIQASKIYTEICGRE